MRCFSKGARLTTFRITRVTCELEDSWTPPQKVDLYSRIWDLGVCILKIKFPFAHSSLWIEVGHLFSQKKCFITFHKHSNKNTSFHDILLSFLPGNAVRTSYVGRCWQSPETMKSTTNSIQKGAIGFQDWRENVEETFAGENPEWWMDCSGLREREVTQQIYTAYYCILYWKAAG